MVLAQQVILLLHLIGFAALLGGGLAQLGRPAPEINAAMLIGALAQLLTGVTLVLILEFSRPDLVDHAQVGVTSGIAVVVAILVVLNRRFSSIPRGLLRLILLLVVADAAIAVLWR